MLNDNFEWHKPNIIIDTDEWLQYVTISKQKILKQYKVAVDCSMGIPTSYPCLVMSYFFVHSRVMEHRFITSECAFEFIKVCKALESSIALLLYQQ